MPHGWKLCLQAFHPSFITFGCYGYLSLLGLAFEGGQALRSAKSQRHRLHQNWAFGHGLSCIASPGIHCKTPVSSLMRLTLPLATAMDSAVCMCMCACMCVCILRFAACSGTSHICLGRALILLSAGLTSQ